MRLRYLLIPLLLLSLNVNAAQKGRFFLEGDGELSIINQAGVKVSGSYRKADGSYDDAYMKRINALFNMPVETMGEGISLRLIAFVDYLEDKYAHGKTLKLLSGFRSPKHNAALRAKGRLAAKTSYHMEGMAADLIFPGVNSKEMWEHARHLEYGGIGYYDGKSVHVDSGKPRFWTSESALPKTNEPPENRNIYMSVDRDIYKAGETMHLFFSGISDYPFGLTPEMEIVKKDKTIEHIRPTVKGQEINSCVVMAERKQVRHLEWVIPDDFKKTDERLQIRVTFCDPTYEKMPKEILSREFEVTH